jgi:hypothetical protein
MLAELSQVLETISERSEHLSHSPRATGENSSPRIPRLAFVASVDCCSAIHSRMTCRIGADGIVYLCCISSLPWLVVVVSE